MNDTETIAHGSAEVAPGPDRVVDARMIGWWRVGPISGGAVDAPAGYACVETVRSSQPHLSLAELEAAHGPLRVVEPMSAADAQAILTALRSAGSKAVTTLAAALGEVWEDALQRYAAADEAAGLAHSERDVDMAMRALVAGRPAS